MKSSPVAISVRLVARRSYTSRSSTIRSTSPPRTSCISRSTRSGVAAVTGRSGTMAQYSRTREESSKVPISRARSRISSLSNPTRGRRTGSSAAASMARRFFNVWELTCPTDSPVISAWAPVSRATRVPARYMSRFRPTCQ